MKEEEYEYPEADSDMKISFHRTSWKQFKAECEMQVIRAKSIGYTEVEIKHSCGNARRSNDFVKSKKGEYLSPDVIVFESTTWASFKMGTHDVTFFWNDRIKYEPMQPLPVSGLKKNVVKLIRNNNKEGKQSCCATYAFLVGVANYMDFNKAPEEEE